MNRSAWRTLTAAATTVGVLLFGLAVNAHMAAADTPPTTTAFFNDPMDPTGRFAIEDQLVDLINGSPAGSTIRINFAVFSSDRLETTLVNAHHRGVTILAAADGQIVQIPGPTDPTFVALQSDLNTSAFTGDTSRLKLCGNPAPGPSGCIGNNPSLHHSKFALFSSTGGVTSVVFETSENAKSDTTTPDSGVLGYNNAVVVVGQPVLYQGYLTRFNAYMNGTNVPYTSANDTTTKGYFLPFPYTRTSPENSPVMGILDNIDCRAPNTSGGWGPNHLTSIHVVQSQWNDANIAQKLLSLDNEGCVVHIVRDKDYFATTEYENVDTILASCGNANGITQDLIDDNQGSFSGTPQLPFIHSKYLIVDGNYNGEANVQRLWTGSYNYTYGALRSNDETLLNVRDNPAVFNAFQANFSMLASLPRTINGLTYRTTIQGGDIGTPPC